MLLSIARDRAISLVSLVRDSDGKEMFVGGIFDTSIVFVRISRKRGMRGAIFLRRVAAVYSSLGEAVSTGTMTSDSISQRAQGIVRATSLRHAR